MKVVKAPGSIANTYLSEVDGVLITGNVARETQFDIRFTSTIEGETLTIIHKGRQFCVPFEPVKELIEYTRRYRR